MKKLVLIFCFLLVLTFQVFAQGTAIPPGSVSGTWTATGSPYNINGEIYIDTLNTLTIEPGVIVLFAGHYKFNIYGRLLAQGAEGDTIVFTAVDPVEGWHGLRFQDTNFNGQDSSKVEYCKIEYGNATGTIPDHRGGGIYCHTSTNVLIKNCSIINNHADLEGGGIYIGTSYVGLVGPDIENTIIRNNSADIRGGGIFGQYATPNIEDVVISGNTANGGGGVYFFSESTPFLTNVTVKGNTANMSGGGLYFRSCNPSLANVIITGNKANYEGGGVFCYDNAHPDFENVTISGNKSDTYGGGLFVEDNCNAMLIGCIVWDNAPDQIYEGIRATDVTYSDIEGATGVWPGTGNTNEDPLFAEPIDPNNAPTTAGDVHITWANYPTNDATKSPCIDTGDPTKYDPDGTRADMGAYYFDQYLGTHIPGGNVSGTWNTAGSPYYILGDIEILNYGNETSLTIDAGVEVIFMGHYKFTINGQLLANGEDGNMITFTIDDTTGFYQYPDLPNGGWHGLRFMGGRGTRDASSLSFCDISYGKAIGQADDANGGAIYTQYNAEVNISSSNIYNNIATGNGGAICSKYTWSDITLFDNLIFNNNAQHGGGVYMTDANLIHFYDNIIYGNTAESAIAGGSGGGIYCSYSSTPTFDGDTIRNNEAYSGGGFYAEQAGPQLSNVVIRNNNADSGAGVYCTSWANIYFYQVAIKNNISDNSGGGLYCEGSSPELHHVLIVENEAGLNGGGLFVTGIDSSPEFYNVTLSDNSATNSGGGLYISSSSEYIFYNSIFWGNIPDQIYTSTRDGEILYSNVQGSWPGNGNIDVDPNYVDPINDNYHLSPFNLTGDDKNPLIDSGTPYNVQLPYTYFEEEPDPNGSWINMGAYGGTDEAAISVTFADGDVDEDEEWESDEMQILTQVITVFDQITLTIQSGTFIDIQDPSIGFEINGSLLAVGTPDNPISFAPNLSGRSRVDTWQGFTFTNIATESSLFDNVIIENAVNGIDLGGNSIDVLNTQILYDPPARDISDGTGIVVGDDSNPNIDNCDVENYNKGIEVKNNSTPTITNSRVRNNPESTRQDEIGIEITESASPLIDLCEIDHFPTGIKIENLTRVTSTPTLTNSRVRNAPESTRENEIGILISGSVEMTIDDCDIEDYPYGIRYLGTGQPTGRVTPTLTNSRVRDNPETTREVILKTGVFVDDLLNFEIDNCDINYYNTAIDIQNDVRIISTPTLTNSRVRNAPESTRDDKIGLRLTGDIYATVDYSEFVNCDSALIINGANTHADINHNLIYMLDLTPIDTAIYANLSTNLEIYNNTIYDYTYGFVAENVTAHFYNNIIWNTDFPIVNLSSNLNVDFNDIVGGYGRANIDSDPMFSDPDNEDFNLMGGSPCIDAGDPSSPQDPDGTPADIGRFYFHQQPTPVVLSSFNAAIIDASPTLNWTTQSETDNIGWNVYRSESEIIEQSAQINHQMISGAGTTSEPTHYEFTDGYEVVPTNTYWYWLESINFSSQTDIYGPIALTIPEDIEPEELPEYTALIGNFPNPFHSKNNPTTISFAIKEGEIGNLTIFNIKGQQVENVQFEQGNWNYKWNSTEHSSGIYFYKLETENFKAVKKMIMLK